MNNLKLSNYLDLIMKIWERINFFGYIYVIGTGVWMGFILKSPSIRGEPYSYYFAAGTYLFFLIFCLIGVSKSYEYIKALYHDVDLLYLQGDHSFLPGEQAPVILKKDLSRIKYEGTIALSGMTLISIFLVLSYWLIPYL